MQNQELRNKKEIIIIKIITIIIIIIIITIIIIMIIIITVKTGKTIFIPTEEVHRLQKVKENKD